MIERLIEFSARNKYLVALLTGLALLGAVYSMKHIPLDAIPDLSDTQVIIYSRWDRSPDLIEDQVTYPIITSMLGAPKIKAIRGFSDFGYSLRLHHFSGRHRPLLGEEPRARISLQNPGQTPGGRPDGTRA